MTKTYVEIESAVHSPEKMLVKHKGKAPLLVGSPEVQKCLRDYISETCSEDLAHGDMHGERFWIRIGNKTGPLYTEHVIYVSASMAIAVTWRASDKID